MSEVDIHLDEVPLQSRLHICRSFFTGPDGFEQHMRKPEVQKRFAEWKQGRGGERSDIEQTK